FQSDASIRVLNDELREIFRTAFDREFPFLPVAPHLGNIVLWSISQNRTAGITIDKSIPCTKADAGRKLFDVDGASISWAILDTGIDARHWAFRQKDASAQPFKDPFGLPDDLTSNHTRISATYDFTKFRDVLVSIRIEKNGELGSKPSYISVTSNKNDKALSNKDVNDSIVEIAKDLERGRMLDWSVISPLLRIPHNNKEYKEPVHDHGTHVAGILGADLEDKTKGTLIGMCPAIELYDIRVMNSEGKGEEFNILAALQFVRWLNSQKDGWAIHGVNLSFSMIHRVDSYACGQTPVCVAAEKLVSDGIVVVAAAGNLGQAMFQSNNGTLDQGFRMVNITDPGNAQEVITVGSTHRNRPHSYGISYFSSKGPTGDGRVKPDLVAPGEKILSAAIGDSTKRMDGTSMATPHVSGAAALLLARNRELIGRPGKVKQILCSTAMDLGREKYFQGCGMVDVLRAIQSV
ncbi:MAG: S8 family peptidase, partial [Candidatus Paceibacterota bacterium]